MARALVYAAMVLVLDLGLGASASDLQSEQMFEWGFTDTVRRSPPHIQLVNLTAFQTSHSLAACGAMSVFVRPLVQYTPVPPFYMAAFPLGADRTPAISSVGRNSSTLEWTVRFPLGTQLLLALVDGHGVSGGVDVPLYTVTDGTTQCMTQLETSTKSSSSAQLFTLTTTTSFNASLATCGHWPLSIAGGTPPFVITVAAQHSPDVTNITLGRGSFPFELSFTYFPGDSQRIYSYTNLAQPGRQMIAAASDSTGSWALGVPFVHTIGTTDVTCSTASQQSNASSTSTAISSSSGSPTAAASTSTPGLDHAVATAKKIVLAVCIVGILCMIGLVWCMLGRRMRRTSIAAMDSRSGSVSPFVGAGSPISTSRMSSKAAVILVGDPNSPRMPTSRTVAASDLPPPYPVQARRDSWFR
ncbi:hypothetical protein C8F01DRAFT_1229145 [Mycena amicta]|nr:hypothetical protein C8F01DRAFT_1229145 [Mycena amicta]